MIGVVVWENRVSNVQEEGEGEGKVRVKLGAVRSGGRGDGLRGGGEG